MGITMGEILWNLFEFKHQCKNLMKYRIRLVINLSIPHFIHTNEAPLINWNKNKSVKALFVFKLYFKTLYIFAEYMTGGSLYDYLHKYHNVLELSQLLKFAIDVCKGMEYLHGNNIIHRDLKTANLLMDTHNVWI